MNKTENEILRTAALLFAGDWCNGESKLLARRRKLIQAVEETKACKFQTQIIRDPKFEELQTRELGTCRRLGRLPACFPGCDAKAEKKWNHSFVIQKKRVSGTASKVVWQGDRIP